MRRHVIGAVVLLVAGLSLAAMVRAQESVLSRGSETLSAQLARIRDGLSANPPSATSAGTHAHATHAGGGPTDDEASPVADWSATRKMRSGGASFRSATPSSQVHNHHPAHNAPAQRAPTARPEVYENPYALSDQYQAARPARPRTQPTEAATAPRSASSQPFNPPPAHTHQPAERPSLQERLSRLLRSDDPEPRSAVAPSRSNPSGTYSATPRGIPHAAQPGRSPAAHGSSLQPHAADSSEIVNDSQMEEVEPSPVPIQTDPYAGSASTGSTLTDSTSAGGAEPEPFLDTDREPTASQPVSATPSPLRQTASADTLFTGTTAQLAATVSGPQSINIGREANYQLAVENTSGTDAADVLVTIDIPAWAEVARATPTAGQVQPSNDPTVSGLLWRVPRLVGQSRERLELDLVPRESQPLELAVQVTHSPLASSAMIEVREPKLQMVVAGPDEVEYGQSKVYQLAVSNPGNGDAENIVIELLPLDGPASSVASHELGTLQPGESKKIEVELTARQPGTLHVRAQATADGDLTAEVDKPVLVRRAALRLNVEAPEAQYASAPATFQIQVNNPGNATARGLKVTAALPSGAKFQGATHGGTASADGGSVTWQVDSLPAQGSESFELMCVLNSPGENRLQVVSDAQSDLTDAAVASVNVIAVADLKLELSDPKGPVAVGGEAVYEVRVRNRGTKAAESVDVVTFFSEGVEPVAASGAEYELGSGQVIFRTIELVPPGGEIVLQIKARADRPGNHSFRAELICHELETKLIAEETTRFYGGAPSAIAGSRELQPAPRTATLEPTPASSPR
ncbi:MAG: hypothetical protein WDZ59_09980 [Pirellulales bacterium]